MTEHDGVIVYQSGYAIFGTGVVLEQAVDEANQWLDPQQQVVYEDIEISRGRGETDGQMYYAPCTARLMLAVDDRGGKVAFEFKDGVADLAE